MKRKFDNKFGLFFQTGMRALGMHEFAPTNEFLNKVKRAVCDEDAITQPLCQNVLFLIGGWGTDQLNKVSLT